MRVVVVLVKPPEVLQAETLIKLRIRIQPQILQNFVRGNTTRQWGIGLEPVGFFEQPEPFWVIGCRLVPRVIIVVEDEAGLVLQHVVCESRRAVLFDVFAGETTKAEGENLPACGVWRWMWVSGCGGSLVRFGGGACGGRGTFEDHEGAFEAGLAGREEVF
jgi:hypothetical protein